VALKANNEQRTTERYALVGSASARSYLYKEGEFWGGQLTGPL
jgi:hypothetical protein